MYITVQLRLILLALVFNSIAGVAQVEPKAKDISWGKGVLDYEKSWYASDDAKKLAYNVLKYQSSQGGWPKNTDLAKPVLSPEDVPSAGSGKANSMDNDATSLPMQFLAKVIHAAPDENLIRSFNKGVDYLLAAQYPNGGWPQFWPLRGDKYYSRITYNDNAMIQVMDVLTGVASGKDPYAFVDKERRKLAADAIELGIDCILKTQVKTKWASYGMVCPT